MAVEKQKNGQTDGSNHSECVIARGLLTLSRNINQSVRSVLIAFSFARLGQDLPEIRSG
jgi:hypothetical protein